MATNPEPTTERIDVRLLQCPKCKSPFYVLIDDLAKQNKLHEEIKRLRSQRDRAKALLDDAKHATDTTDADVWYGNDSIPAWERDKENLIEEIESEANDDN